MHLAIQTRPSPASASAHPSFVLSQKEFNQIRMALATIHSPLRRFIRMAESVRSLREMASAGLPERIRDLPANPDLPFFWSAEIAIRKTDRRPVIASLNTHDAVVWDAIISDNDDPHTLTKHDRLLEAVGKRLKRSERKYISLSTRRQRGFERALMKAHLGRPESIFGSFSLRKKEAPVVLDFPIPPMNRDEEVLLDLAGDVDVIVQPHVRTSHLNALAVMRGEDFTSAHLCRIAGIDMNEIREYTAKTDMIPWNADPDILLVGFDDAVIREASPTEGYVIVSEHATLEGIRESARLRPHQRVIQERLDAPFADAPSSRIIVIACDDDLLAAVAVIHEPGCRRYADIVLSSVL